MLKGKGQRVTGYGLRVTGYGLRVTGYGFRVTGLGVTFTFRSKMELHNVKEVDQLFLRHCVHTLDIQPLGQHPVSRQRPVESKIRRGKDRAHPIGIV